MKMWRLQIIFPFFSVVRVFAVVAKIYFLFFQRFSCSPPTFLCIFGFCGLSFLCGLLRGGGRAGETAAEAAAARAARHKKSNDSHHRTIFD